jgi:hypothetical protein
LLAALARGFAAVPSPVAAAAAAYLLLVDDRLGAAATSGSCFSPAAAVKAGAFVSGGCFVDAAEAADVVASSPLYKCFLDVCRFAVAGTA